jgi:hypothetical protein
VVLDVGTNNEQLLHDPLYLGMGHPRLENEEYYSFVEEWVQAVKARWPSKLLIGLRITENVFAKKHFCFL